MLFILYRPFLSLREGNWFKLICGASYQHLPAARSFALAYALAGADCIDVAADPAIISAAKEALRSAQYLSNDATQRGFLIQGMPWLMVSLNDGEDPHFRKAEFNPDQCPADCSRPCEKVCPADAIAFPVRFLDSSNPPPSPEISKPIGVIRDRCYGCGRCLPVCPIQHITTQSHVASLDGIAPSVLSQVDAVEIHTQVGRTDAFAEVWQAIAPFISQLKLVAVSCPDGDELIPYLRELYRIMQPTPPLLIWQTDGRPMSGDIGKGTTHATIRLAQKVLAAHLPGYVQLAGGTNAHTVPKLRNLNLLQPGDRLAGVAYGSYARTLLTPIFDELEQRHATGQSFQLEQHPDLLWQAVRMAHALVAPLKFPDPLAQTQSAQRCCDAAELVQSAVPVTGSPDKGQRNFLSCS